MGGGWNAIKHILWGAETHVHMTCEPNGVGDKEEIKKTHTHTHSIRTVISIRRACGICVASEKCMDDAVEKKKKINAYMNDVVTCAQYTEWHCNDSLGIIRIFERNLALPNDRCLAQLNIWFINLLAYSVSVRPPRPDVMHVKHSTIELQPNSLHSVSFYFWLIRFCSDALTCVDLHTTLEFHFVNRFEVIRCTRWCDLALEII